MFTRVVRVRSLFTLAIIVFCALLGAGLTQVFSGEPGRRAYDTSNLVRLRFVANSDSPEDQEVKRFVRDAVLEGSREWIDEAASGREMRRLVEANRDGILDDAKRAIDRLGRDDPVRITWGMLPYEADPEAPVHLPSGRYLTLQVIIGEGAGHNWWCLLFPTLCFGSQKGIEPILPGGEGVELPGGAALPQGAADRQPGEGRADEDPSIRWALAGFNASVQASEGSDGRAPAASPGVAAAREGAVDGARPVPAFELHLGLYRDDEALDHVRLRLGLFR